MPSPTPRTTPRTTAVQEPTPAGPRAAGAASTNPTQPSPPAAPEKPAGRRKLKRTTRIALLIVLVLTLIAAGEFTARYVVATREYVSTDNAQVDGNEIVINAPSSGTLINWRATQGTELRTDQVVGRIRIAGGFVQPQQSIRAPADSTVAVDNGVEGAFVTAGTQLALAYDLTKVYVTARVDETDIAAVHPGQRADFTIDAYPGIDFTGTVAQIQGGAAGVFAAFPPANTSGNYQKVTQVVAVKISINDLRGLSLVPGMNVTVKIHRNGQ